MVHFFTIIMNHEFCLRSTFTFTKSCEVFLHHIRNATGPKDTPLKNIRLSETFFQETILHQRVPFQFFEIFPENGCLKISKDIPFSFFRHCETFLLCFHKREPNSSVLWHFEVLLLFLSLRYGADLGRSRLVNYGLVNVSFSTCWMSSSACA